MACAAEVATAVPCTIEVVENKKQALVALRRAEFAAVVVDEGVAEDDEESGEQLWRATGMAVPVQVNFAISSAKRLVRELRAALHRQQLEQSRARETTLAVMKAEVGSALTGILLELELLAGMAQIPPEGQERLRHIAGLTTALRRKLDVGNAAAMAQSIRAREVQRETVRQALLDRREAARSAASKTTTVMAGTDPAGTTTPKLQAPGSPSTEPLMS
jgi:signal transduction histidine kinase